MQLTEWALNLTLHPSIKEPFLYHLRLLMGFVYLLATARNRTGDLQHHCAFAVIEPKRCRYGGREDKSTLKIKQNQFIRLEGDSKVHKKRSNLLSKFFAQFSISLTRERKKVEKPVFKKRSRFRPKNKVQKVVGEQSDQNV